MTNQFLRRMGVTSRNIGNGNQYPDKPSGNNDRLGLFQMKIFFKDHQGIGANEYRNSQ